MDEIYKISSTERVQRVEKELAVQLAELKTEIEENGVLQGTPHKAYSLIPEKTQVMLAGKVELLKNIVLILVYLAQEMASYPDLVNLAMWI
ncbi:UNVERIFIED_CONTAM: hypothetical protein K2H54_069192 [Gekko kuhli]